MSKRSATHAGSWYSAGGSKLSKELDGWLGQVSDDSLPEPSARVIIAPHAGYSYSGPTAAWAYKALDVTKAKRVFLLGPSHHFYLSNCAVTQCSYYSTPLGDLKIDQEISAELIKTGKFGKMNIDTDEDEHSLELHLPYIYKMLSKTFSDVLNFPTLVPILVGNTSGKAEKEYGALMAPYLADPANIFVISSDFAHWGLRFHYTYYLPKLDVNEYEGVKLRASDKGPFREPQIHESIERVDRLCMTAIESGSHDSFLEAVERTGNTVCGRHPIGIILAALEIVEGKTDGEVPRTTFKFIKYARSSDCVRVEDSSVSYASAFARI